MTRSHNPITLDSVPFIEALPGIRRQTLAFNSSTTLCHFTMQKGTSIPLHNHKECQIGYVIQGKARFFTELESFEVTSGFSYVFDPNEKHGAEFLEPTEIIEVFSPCRDEYLPSPSTNENPYVIRKFAA